MGSVVALTPRHPDGPVCDTLDAIDRHIGLRIRRRRRLLGLSQGALGEACGVSFQQIQKFECAAVRLSAVRLWVLADALRVSISYFYEGLTSAQRDYLVSQGEAPSLDAAASDETQDLIATYYKLGEIPRRRLLDLARAMNGQDET